VHSSHSSSTGSYVNEMQYRMCSEGLRLWPELPEQSFRNISWHAAATIMHAVDPTPPPTTRRNTWHIATARCRRMYMGWPQKVTPSPLPKC